MIGNKADLEDSRKISKEQGEQLKKDFEFDLFMETSAKSGLNATELFIEAAKTLYKEHSKFKKQKKLGENLKKEHINNHNKKN